jgi:hypothetical protein
VERLSLTATMPHDVRRDLLSALRSDSKIRAREKALIDRRLAARPRLGADGTFTQAQQANARGFARKDLARQMGLWPRPSKDEAVLVNTDEAGMREGGRREDRHLTIERSSNLRARALAYHGTVCNVCRFSFKATYGSIGDGFAEVHHLAPLGTLKGEMLVKPTTDVVVLCANCHRMVHRHDPPLTPDELRDAMSRN